MWLEEKPSKRNFASVLKLMEEAEVTEKGKPSMLDTRMKFLEATSPLKENHPAVKQYNKCMRGAGDTVRSIIISANSRLATLENKQVLRMLSRDELNLAELGIGVNGDGKTKTALFCVIPDSDKSYNYIIGMLYTQIFQELYYQADFNCGGRLPVHVTFMLDEFANVALPDDYCSLLSTMRSREISSVIIIQNLAQIKALFKDTWETIPGNCDSLVYLGGNEASTHKYISELLGKATIDKKSSGETRGRQGSSSRNYDVLGREIMTPDEVRKMDNKKCLIFIRGFDPILDSKYNPFKHPVFAQTADGEGKPYVHEPTAEGDVIGPGFTILNKKSLAYYEGMKEKGEPVYIDEIPYEDFILLGQVDMEKRFMELDEQEQRERMNEDAALELEYAFDMEDGAAGGFAAGQAETSGNQTADNSVMPGSDGLPEGFVIGDSDGTGKTQAAEKTGVRKAPVPGGTGKAEPVADGRKMPEAGRTDKAGDSISYRLFHWKFSVEQKEEVKRAMAVRVPKEVILSYFYPETPVVRMMEIRRRYE